MESSRRAGHLRHERDVQIKRDRRQARPFANQPVDGRFARARKGFGAHARRESPRAPRRPRAPARRARPRRGAARAASSSSRSSAASRSTSACRFAPRTPPAAIHFARDAIEQIVEPRVEPARGPRRRQTPEHSFHVDRQRRTAMAGLAIAAGRSRICPPRSARSHDATRRTHRARRPRRNRSARAAAAGPLRRNTARSIDRFRGTRP